MGSISVTVDTEHKGKKRDIRFIWEGDAGEIKRLMETIVENAEASGVTAKRVAMQLIAGLPAQGGRRDEVACPDARIGGRRRHHGSWQ